ncbi:MGMT family protein [Roseococcus microcysteis]|uniref:MGMT family protein n=1 Tax=Roseococcus microcysteis TaxID=2771361 RepID=UPI00168A6BA1|nr:MGMT family protein [Roseococcus microcysteis]
MTTSPPEVDRLRADVLAITTHVPRGALVTFATVAAHLDARPRDVADIIASLDGPERDRLPWHRLVAVDGRVAEPAQRALLEAEGYGFDAEGYIAGFPVQLVDVDRLKHGVPARTPPA